MVTLQKSTQDLICQSLRSRIASGDLEPGTELKQVELAKTYGVSRMPIREALQGLMLEGLVTRLSNRHMVVSSHAREILENRKVPRTEENKAPAPEEKAAGSPAYRVETETVPETIGKIHLLPAREQVASYLRKAILRREIPEGSVLTLEETARHMGVSTTPVREALQLLATQGLVRLRPNKGAVVLGIDEKSIRDHFAVREILEREAAALAARPGSDLREVERVYAGMQECLAQHRYAEYKHYNETPSSVMSILTPVSSMILLITLPCFPTTSPIFCGSMVICLIFGAYGLKCFLGSEITGLITLSRICILASLVLAMASSIIGRVSP